MTEAEAVGVATLDADDRVRHALVADLDGGFVVLYETYQRLVFSTALRLCGRWADAEDLAAEAFLRSYRALAGYERARIGSLRHRAGLVAILLNVTWKHQTQAAWSTQ